MWDKIKTQCTKGKDNFMALPTPEEIGELVCKLAASEMLKRKRQRRSAKSSRSISHR